MKPGIYKRMRIKTKTILFMQISTAVLVLILFIVSRFFLLESFEELERMENIRYLNQLRSAIDRERNTFLTLAKDWAYRDDTYNYMSEKQNGFIESNLVDQTFINLHINLFAIVSPNGEYIYSNLFDLKRKQSKPVTESLKKALDKTGAVTRHSNIESVKTPILIIRNKPMMTASVPILTSDRKGPINGTLIMGRFLDEDFFDKLAASTLFNITAQIPSVDELGPEFQTALLELSARTPYYVRPKSKDVSEAFTILTGPDDEIAVIFKITSPRLIMGEARSIIYNILFYLIAAGFLISITVVYFINKLLLNRLEYIGNRVQQIGMGGQMSERLSLPAHDELGRMAGEIDRMLEALDASAKSRREAEKLYRAVTETIPAGVIILQGDELKYANPGWRELCAAESPEIAADDFWSSIDSPFREEFKIKCLEQQQGLKNISNYEFVLHSRNGLRKWVNFTATTISHKQRTALLGIGYDITARKTAESVLRENEYKYRSILESTAHSIVIFEVESGKMIEVNRGFSEMADCSKEEAIGGTLSDVGLQTISPGGDEFDRLIQGQREIDGFPLQFSNKNGRLFDAVISTRPIEYAGKACLVTVIQDVTNLRKSEKEQLKLQSQLEHSQKMESIGSLAGGIAHDFNNILQIISSYMQLMELKFTLEPEIISFINEINHATEHAVALVRHLLTFSRRLEPEFKTVHLNDVVNQTLTIIKRTIPKMIQLDVNLSKESAIVFADPNQIEQVLVNLCTNARDAMPEGGVIKIETGETIPDDILIKKHPNLKKAQYAVITLSDTGKGMDAETLKKIFDPFFTTKEIGKGTGLGLATVYGIVQSHNGTVVCESAPGDGALFRIFIPVQSTGPGERGEEKADGVTHLACKPKSILLVDDEAGIIIPVRNILSAKGHYIETASSGEEALEKFNDGKNFDLVVLDLGMPGMGGFKCLEKLKETAPDIKVIIASGYADKSIIENLRKSGAEHFLPKPFRINDLMNLINGLN